MKATDRFVNFCAVIYGKKRGTDDGLLEEVSSFLEKICSFLEEISSFIEVVLSSLGRICSFLEDFSSSTYHCSSGNHCGPVADLSSDRLPDNTIY